MHELAVEPEHVRKQAAAQRDRVARDGVEYRLHIRRRTADHPQDLARRGLLLERFLRLVAGAAELDFGALALRDVGERPDDLRDHTVGVAHPDTPIENPEVSAAGVDEPVFVLEVRRAPLEVLGDRGAVARIVVAVDAGIPGGGRELVTGERKERFRMVGEKKPPRDDVPFVDALERCRGRQRVALLDLAQALLGLPKTLAQFGQLAGLRPPAIVPRGIHSVLRAVCALPA